VLLKQLGFIEKHAHNPGQLLDIGCATGEFMSFTRQHGWNVSGIELVGKAAQIAREVHGLNVYQGPIESIALPENHFDVITLWDVLEHLPSPRTTLIHARRLLKPGGLLVFSIPNLTSFDRYIFGTSWIGWDAPRHLYLFSPDNLDQLMKIAGFSLIEKQCLTGGKGTFLLSLEQLLDGRKNASSLMKIASVLSIALWPYRQISYLLEKGPIITLAARKL
jgi:SAM-dependent methyltransferase